MSNYPSKQVPLNIVGQKVLPGQDPVPGIPGHQIEYIGAVSQVPVPKDGALSFVVYYGHSGKKESARCTDTVLELTTALASSIPLTLTNAAAGLKAGDTINVNVAHIVDPMTSKTTGTGTRVSVRHPMAEDPIVLVVDETKAAIGNAINVVAPGFRPQEELVASAPFTQSLTAACVGVITETTGGNSGDGDEIGFALPGTKGTEAWIYNNTGSYIFVRGVGGNQFRISTLSLGTLLLPPFQSAKLHCTDDDLWSVNMSDSGETIPTKLRTAQAQPSTQAGATLAFPGSNIFQNGSGQNGDGIKVPRLNELPLYTTIEVVNNTDFSMNLYPGTLNNLGNGVNQPITLPARRGYKIQKAADVFWQVLEASMEGFAQAVEQFTANAGGAQPNATVLTARTNNVTQVTSLNDSVKMPAFFEDDQGHPILVCNFGGNAMALFPDDGGKFVGELANAAISIPVFGVASVTQVETGSPGEWAVILS